MTIDLEKANEIVARFKDVEGALLECLHALQHSFGYVPAETLDIMADGFNISRAEVHGVISYYHDFKTSPTGRTVVRVCQAEACQSMGSRHLSEHVQKKLGINMGETGADGNYSLEAVYCFGNCALSPNIEIDGKLHARVGPDKFDEIINAGEKL
ncbi:MAG: formate dehydrogenase subunit gamma [Kordiimonadaceae bacterium]|jgi:formate dehydrogenase subunit gamma|nr:formate dehydrogenase subunit gamma [Kordiimonadaceae bacterium]MBT6329040.1 formate dehydrogenase subunit gamma [Kordiimonadaceae bacterium]MBT7582068.1 formate dehydrogenase subunit gamma [Kordiimonadaceae bacterium]